MLKIILNLDLVKNCFIQPESYLSATIASKNITNSDSSTEIHSICEEAEEEDSELCQLRSKSFSSISGSDAKSRMQCDPIIPEEIERFSGVSYGEISNQVESLASRGSVLRDSIACSSTICYPEMYETPLESTYYQPGGSATLQSHVVTAKQSNLISSSRFISRQYAITREANDSRRENLDRDLQNISSKKTREILESFRLRRRHYFYRKNT